jgi:hypothetical protein
MSEIKYEIIKKIGVLSKSAPPPEEWANALTRIFGTDEWQEVFYRAGKFLHYLAKKKSKPKRPISQKLAISSFHV